MGADGGPGRSRLAWGLLARPREGYESGVPVKSMTGFGLAERAWSEHAATVRVELRSVNARFLELKLRQPFGVATEHALRKQVERQLGRGRVDVGIHVDESGASSDTWRMVLRIMVCTSRGVISSSSASSSSEGSRSNCCTKWI